jgi:hypothetical protein
MYSKVGYRFFSSFPCSGLVKNSSGSRKAHRVGNIQKSIKMKFEERQELIKKNTDLKAAYGLNAPSLPRVLRKDAKEINDGHTQSVLRGYKKRVYNFLKAHPLNTVGHVQL